MEPEKSVAVFGLGALGLSVIQAAKKAGAKDIVGVDLNESKFEIAKELGGTSFVNPSKSNDGGKGDLLKDHKWGYDYTFDCTGNVNVMRCALEVAHRGWGESCIIGVAAAGKEISTRPFQLGMISHKMSTTTISSKLLFFTIKIQLHSISNC